MRSGQKRFRYRLEWAGLTLAAKIVPLLSRRACFHLAGSLGTLMSIFDRQGRQVALSNLEVAFGDQLTARQRRKITRESFQHFARTMIDLLWTPRLTRENFLRYIELENVEEMMQDIGPDRIFILACYHYSNFEWVSHAFAFQGLNATIIAQDFKNAQLNPIFKKLRELSGHEFIPRERGILRLYKVLRRKGRTALLTDLTVPPGKGAVVINCFGLKTSVISTHAWLHQQTGAVIIPAHCEPLADGRYRVIYHPKIAPGPTTSHQEIAQACWDSFAPYVRKNPAPWLWMYKHWRYKPVQADRAYPFYAQSWKAFEQLLSHDPDDRRPATPDKLPGARLTSTSGDPPIE